MKAIQTLWCGDRDLETSPFWWLHAEYNLMSWALSCMSLKEQFGKVTLYTDSRGARMLADRLGLPYDEVVVCFDTFDCLTCHWALAKVKTYSVQTEPFVHIDGDIYLPRPLPGKVTGARLVAQNKEQCTDYYGGMIRKFLAVEGLKLSPQFDRVLRGGDVPSYNLGFCGGNDLDFFGRYCDEIFRFFRDNDFNGDRFRFSDISANVVYEQVFFAIMARDECVDVTTVHPDAIRDNGYMQRDFCDLPHYGQKQFIHILGGHKRTPEVCNMLERTLLREYPAMYERVAALFPERHKRLSGQPVHVESTQEFAGLENYRTFLNSCNEAWNGIGRDALLAEARKASVVTGLADKDKPVRDGLVFSRNPFLKIYNIPVGEADMLKKRLKVSPAERKNDVAITPSVSGNGFAEYALDDLSYNVLTLLDEPKTFACLSAELKPCFAGGTPPETVGQCLERTLGGLLSQGMVTACG